LKGPTFNTRKKRGRRKGRHEGRKKARRERKREREEKRGKARKGATSEQPSLILKFWCHATLVCPYIV